MSYPGIYKMRQQMIRETEEFLNKELMLPHEGASINPPQRTVFFLPGACPRTDILEPIPMCNCACNRN